MPKALPQDAIEQNRRDGYYVPLPVRSGAEAAGLRAGIEAFEATRAVREILYRDARQATEKR